MGHLQQVEIDVTIKIMGNGSIISLDPSTWLHIHLDFNLSFALIAAYAPFPFKDFHQLTIVDYYQANY